jgi:antirestriction protein ArdC
LNLFKDSESYYVTLYHELIHSTGHSKRLNRFADNVDSGIFGSESYSKEELIAELGAAFLCARTKIDNRQVKQSAGYIQSWLKALKNDSRFVIHAASKAQKAVDFVTGQKNHHR